jgi:nucleoside-diphosphate-sugar epimerase
VGPRSCYDEGKRCAETLFFDYRRQHNLQIKVARIFNTYGPRMHPNDGRVVSNFIVQALLGRDITVYGEGLQENDPKQRGTRSFLRQRSRGWFGLDLELTCPLSSQPAPA